MPQYGQTLGLNKAKDNPVVTSAVMDSGDFEVGGQEPRVMSTTGPASEAMDEPSFIQIADRPLEGMDQEKLAMLAFMNELVTIRIPNSTNPSDEKAIPLNINGESQVFIRGQETTCKRFFVDHLLRLKTTRYDQKMVKNSEGEGQYVHIPVTNLRYEVSMIRDVSPFASNWYQNTIAMPG